MTSKSTPWDDIGIPDSDYNVRLVEESNIAAPLYWGRDIQGHCLFIVELDSDHVEQFQKNRITVHGIRVDLRMLEKPGCQGLVLTLEQHVDKDLFSGLCETLASNLRDVSDSSNALSVALTHLQRWKAFLAGRKARLLSDEGIRGLFGELQFLRMLYQGHLHEKAALEAWCGPHGGHQDFIFGNTAVEVKTLSGRERNTIKISSEDQLETLCDNLFLAIFRLSNQPNSDLALSLNDAVKIVEGELTDSFALEELSSKLSEYGYIAMHEYDEPKLAVTGRWTYHVTDNFPRIIRSGLPAGLTRVGYEIELEAITSFECETTVIWGEP